METLKNPKRCDKRRFENANFLERQFFTYISPTFREGNKRVLEPQDIAGIEENHKSAVVVERLRSIWSIEKQHSKEAGKKPSFFRAMLLYAFPTMVRAGLFAFAQICLRILQPFLLKQVIDSISNKSKQEDAVYWGLGLVATLLITPNLHPHVFLVQELLGTDIKSAGLTLIFKKALRVHQGGISKITTGKLVTLVSTDAQKLQEGLYLFHSLWVGPLVIIATTAILWQALGPSCLAGISILILMIPLQSFFGKTFAKLRSKTVGKTDQRVNTMNEIISSMQVTKMYTWENSFAKMISDIRKKETNCVMRSAMLKAFNMAFSMSSNYIVLFATFSTYYFHGSGHVTLGLLFQAMSLFFLVRTESLLLFPIGFQLLMESKIGCQRIAQFLLTEEMEEKSEVKKTSEPKMDFDNVTASWTEESEEILKSVSFSVNEKNKLMMLVGPVGSGKSSILNAALREMSIKKGSINTQGKVVYTSQQSWIFSSTIRQNIIFGNEFDVERYKRVIDACALKTDLKLFEKGDLTLVGERGVSLSGGQKARIGLARAVYQNADIYLLDDPLSAVDTKVARHIFEKCINGLLKNKLKVLVTHQIQYLQHASSIYTMKEGNAVKISLEEIVELGIDIGQDEDDVAEDQDKLEREHEDHHDHHKENLHLEVLDEDLEDMATLACSTSFERSSIRYRLSRSNSRKSINSMVFAEEELDNEANSKEEKQTKQGAVKADIYYQYYKDGLGWFVTLCLFLGIVFVQVLFTMTDYFMASWARSEEQRARNEPITDSFIFTDNPTNNIYTFAVLAFLTLICNYLRTAGYFISLVKCSRVAHNSMFDAVLKSPIYFFDTNPVGQILNRFSRDIFQMDDELPWKSFDAINNGVLMTTLVAVNIVSMPYLLIIVVPLAVIFYKFREYYMKTSRQIRRLEASSRSPLYTHISATFSGLTTIRAFDKQDKIMEEFFTCQDYQASAWIVFVRASRWFCYRLDMMAAIFGVVAVLATTIAVRYTDVDPGLAGISLSYVMILPGLFQWAIRQSTEVSNLMVAVERVREYSQLEAEEDVGNNEKIPKGWPSRASITASKASFQYHHTLPAVLKQVNFEIKEGEKIGIVGRTGAGKSSLLNMLFRMGKNNGAIKIDGYDIQNLKLQTLRNAISVIPQV
eukprot:TCONS_00012747-protein